VIEGLVVRQFPQAVRDWIRLKQEQMSITRIALAILGASVVLLALGTSPEAAARASLAESRNMTIPYAGRLSDDARQPVADGAYNFTFTLYESEAGGESLWSEVQRGVVVSNGEFLATLGSVEPIPATALSSQNLWLAVSVRGPGEAGFTALAPRQRVTAAAPAAGPACPHDHFGESWSGSGLYGLLVETTNGNFSGALYGRTVGIGSGVYGEALGSTSINTGVLGTSNSSVGYGGKFTNTGGGTALYVENGNGGIALHATGNGSGSPEATLRVGNTNFTNGVAAYLTSNSSYPTLEIDKVNPGGAAIDLQLFNPGNADPAMFIEAYDENTILQFLVSTNGIVAANGYIDWKADIAEMLPAAKGLEPGDVLAIGPDGNLTRSTEPYQTSVAGVYSSDPGFMLGHPLEGKTPGTIPLVMTGVVPVKASAENGPIRPGDLLVASSTLGHAMKAGANPPQGSVIGKALEAWDEGTATIKMLAMLQ
jgi:hypothetical protein